MTATRYRYVGPTEIRDATHRSDRIIVHSRQTVAAWLDQHIMPCTYTYIVDIEGLLRLASRHSEHVACADGNDASLAMYARQLCFLRQQLTL